MRRGSVVTFTALLLWGCGSGIDKDRPTKRVSIQDIYVAYRDNPVAAQQDFANVNLLVTGPIDSIELDSSGGPALFLSAPHGRIAAIELNNPEAAAPVIAKMHVKQTISVLCQSVRMTTGSDPIYLLSGCDLAS